MSFRYRLFIHDHERVLRHGRESHAERNDAEGDVGKLRQDAETVKLADHALGWARADPQRRFGGHKFKRPARLVQDFLPAHPDCYGFVYAFFGGRPVDGFMGAVPESQIKQFVDRLIQASGGAPGGEGGPGDEIPELLEHAKAAVAQNDWDLAARVYSEILGVEPTHVAALAGMARYHVQAGDLEQAKELLGQVPAKDKTNPDVVTVQASIDLAEKAKEAGPVDDLKAKAAANPKDMQARLDLTMAYWANNQRQEAIDELLAMIKADRKWNEEAARQQLLKFFEALGFADPLAVDGRKRLSTVLFS